MIQHWIGFILFLLLSLAGFALTILGIGGTFVVLAGALLYNLITWSFQITLTTLIIVAVLAVLGEILEWFVTFVSSKKKGVSGWGIFGTIVGAIVGGILFSPLFPILGSVAGIIVGAAAGAFIFELIRKQDFRKAWKAAKAALLGRVFVSATKTLLLFIQVILVIKDVF